MADKTNFSDLLSSKVDSKIANIPKDQVACVNCAHSRIPPKLEVGKPYVICKKGPPSVLIQPVGMGTNQLAIANRWPAMTLDEECGSFQSKFAVPKTVI